MVQIWDFHIQISGGGGAWCPVKTQACRCINESVLLQIQRQGTELELLAHSKKVQLGISDCNRDATNRKKFR